MSRWRYILLLVAVQALFAISCQRRPMVEEDLGVILRIEVDYDFPNYTRSSATEYMNVSVYDEASDKLRSVDITDIGGGEVNIPAGNFNMLIHNMGTSYTQIRNRDSFFAAEAYTNDISRFLLNKLQHYVDSRGMLSLMMASSSQNSANSASGASTSATENPEASEVASEAASESDATDSYVDERIVYTPDYLFVAREKNLDIPIRIEGEAPILIETTARSVVESWKLDISIITGLENVSEIAALITGMHGSNFIADDLCTDEVVTIYKEISIDQTTTALSTVFNTFGKHPDRKNILSLVVTDTSGGQYQYNFDITDQFTNNNNDQRIIVTTDINIPKPEHGGGGFKPSVDGWDDVNTEIEI